MAPPLAPPRNPRYSALDAWRGVACLMIVLLHAIHRANEGGDAAGSLGKFVQLLLSKLGVGVPMFFVISGYCIAATADSTRRRPRAPGQFFLRRFRRIYPPFWIFVSASLLIVVALAAVGQGDLLWGDYGFIPHPSWLSWSQWVGNLTLTETWRPHLFGEPQLKIIGPSWTLCYEEQFYAVCGLLLVVSPTRFFKGAALVTVLTLIVAPLGFLGPRLAIQGFFFDGRWLMFAEGIAVYYLLNYSRSALSRVGFFGGLLLGAAAFRWAIPAVAANELWRDRAWEFVVSTAFAWVLLLTHRWDRWVAPSWPVRPFALCGQMCYSLYLVHWPITIALTTYFYRAGVRGPVPTLLLVAPLAVVASLACSWVFHRIVERKFFNGPITNPGHAAAPKEETPTGRSQPVEFAGSPPESQEGQRELVEL